MDQPTTARDRANAAQRVAADPQVSAFVSASAGSGKTKLLTDRLLRLMLDGAEPARIQCLTYTTAAAAEMALRLRRELGVWATASNAGLGDALQALGFVPDAAVRERARRLFARVLDLPGGMRIETIHAFCQSLLRRFPLEANISPHFRLLADADAHASLLAAQEVVLAGEDPASAARDAHQPARRAALDEVASATDLRNFFGLARTLAEERERVAPLRRAGPEEVARLQRQALGVGQDAATLLAQAVSWPEEPAVVNALRVVAEKGPPKRAAPDARRRLAWLSLPPDVRAARWHDYAASWMSTEGEPLAMRTLMGSALETRNPEVAVVIGDEVGRVLEVQDALRSLRVATLSAALLALALPVTESYAAAKQGSARLDYGDLIDGTLRLLQDPGAAWVLHKLDGGLDHLLLDEVQDTSPAQWAIAGALVADFFAGSGARDVRRTMFAVGDRKQSIFSFQGAEPEAFDTWRERLKRLATDAGEPWRDVRLDVSFRSTEPVLALVDAVFDDPVAAHGVTDLGMRHESDRVGQAGAVMLWPLEKPLEKTEPPAWDAPVRRERAKGASQRLAERVADWIAAAVAGALTLPSRGRMARPGDILVLVRRRDDLARAIVRALKHRGVPVAGLDRMTLTEQPAVADLLALGDALLLPRDDLAVACVLTSPLGGLNDDDLIALAPERSGTLWDELRRRAAERPAWQAAWHVLSTLFARVDFTTPHALLVEALGPLGGRARLLARLGAEAAEPIDELLAAALAYNQDHPPSLQGFLHWLRRSAAQVKRQPEAAGGLVRLMTVHGAKGLQAPVVILPDTTALPPEQNTLFWADVEGLAVPIWVPGKEFRSRPVRALRDAVLARSEAEHHRLLYVALTRAEDQLIVCGAETHNKLAEDCWYRLVEHGFGRIDTESVETATGAMLRRVSVQTAAPDRDQAGDRAPRAQALPEWAGAAPSWRPPPPPPSLAAMVRLAPSRPRDADLGTLPPAGSPLTRAGAGRFERGRLLHALLQHLPALPKEAWPAAAEHFLARSAGLDAAAAAATRAEVLTVLRAPAIAEAFGPGSRAEAALTGVVAGQVVGGLVDRLAVLPDRVLIVDYKTNRLPPAAVEAVPLQYLRQMAAYRAVLAAIHPDRPIRCILVWTVGAAVMELPDRLLDRHAPGAAPG